MTTLINFNLPNIWPQQDTSIFAQQTTGISVNITNLMNLMLPVMVIGMMMKMVAGMTNAPIRVKTTTSESKPPQLEQPNHHSGWIGTHLVVRG
jgi:hypothetical protein